MPHALSTPIRDTFTRANEGPEPTGWGTYASGFTVTANQATPVNDNVGQTDYWTGAGDPFDASLGIEVFMTLAAKPADGNYATIGWSGAASFNGYVLIANANAGVDALTLFRSDAGATNTTLATINVEMPIGSRFGFRSYKGTHEIFLDVGTGWRCVAIAYDETYQTDTDVHLTMGTRSIASRFTNFGGGNRAATSGLPNIGDQLIVDSGLSTTGGHLK